MRTNNAPSATQGDSTGITSVAVLSAEARRLLEESASDRTRKAYEQDWARWVAWCQKAGVRALPANPVQVANFVGDASSLGYVRMLRPQGRKGPEVAERRWYAASTLRRWVAAIDAVHRAARDEDPTIRVPGESQLVRKALSGLARTRARQTDKPRSKAPAKALLLPELRRMVEGIDTDTYPGGVAGRRDRAMLLVGFAMAARPSEVTGLTVGQVTWRADDGLHVFLPFRKNDQGGKGTTQGVPRGEHLETCAPCAVTWWMQVLAAVGGDLGASRSQMMRAILAHPVDRTRHVCEQAPPSGWGLPAGLPLFTTVHKTGLLGAQASPDVVRDVVRRRRRAVGLDPDGYSGHSLRVGAITWADRQGATTSEKQALSGHKSADMLEVYRRRENPLEGNAVTKLGM